jgi:LuxR family transcriptional regulator, maltose regulon positive regulatory protein
MIGYSQSIPKLLRTELPRQHVLTKLAEARDAKVVALFAPAGYGKTTVLAQWARNTEQAVIWLTLTEEHKDPLVICAALQQAIQDLFPGIQSFSLTNHSPLELAKQLCRMLGNVEKNLVLILDQINHISLEVGSWCEAFIAQLPEGHQILISGYGNEHIRLARFVAAGEAVILGVNDLAFSLQETSTYLCARDYQGQVEQTQKDLEGWPAGVALVAAGASEFIQPLDLLLDVLHALPSNLRATLPEASVMDVWSEENAQLLACDLPEGWLRQVHSLGLPMSPLGAGVFRPHSLLLEMLERELRRSKTRFLELHQRAAIQAAQRHETLKAIRHFDLAGEQLAVERLVFEHVIALETRSEYRYLREFLENQLHLSSRLKAVLACALMNTGDSARAEKILNDLLPEYQDAHVHYGLGMLAGRQGEYALQLSHAQTGLAQPSDDYMMARLNILKALSLIALQRHPESLEIAFEVERSALKREDFSTAATALNLIQGIWATLNNWTEHDSTLERGAQVFQKLHAPTAALQFQTDLIDRYRIRGLFPEALNLWEESYALAAREQNTVLAFLTEARANLFLWDGSFELAAAEYRQAIGLFERFGLTRIVPRVWLKIAETALYSQDLHTAQMALDKAESLSAKPSAWLESAFCFVKGLQAFMAGDTQQALNHFSQVGSASSEASHRPRALAYLVLLSLKPLSLKPKTKTTMPKELNELVKCLKELGSNVILKLDSLYLEPLFNVWREQAWYPEVYSGLVLLVSNKVPVLNPPLNPQALILKLSITSLGSFAVQIAGKRLHVQLIKSIELLVYLALHGSSSRETLIDVLWNGSREPRHAEYFRVAVRRLRANLATNPLIDFDPIPFEHNVYRLADQLNVELDAHLIQAALDTGQPEIMLNAFMAYAGDFLPESSLEWVEQTRTDLREAAIMLATRVAAGLEYTDSDMALRVYRKASTLDPFAPFAYLGQCRVYFGLKEQHTAQNVMQQYFQVLEQEFGEVDPEIRDQFERVLKP